MVTRRHNGAFVAEVSSSLLLPSPTKEDVRRRLFDTPQKSFRSREIGGEGRTWAMPLSRNVLASLLSVGVLLLLGGGYVFLSEGVHSGTNNSAGAVPTSWRASNHKPLRNRSVPLVKRPLQSLQEKDWNQYTIRINTWHRPEQLLVSVDWHAQCPGVAQIQVVWCDPDNEPPSELANYDKVVIERHTENSLNERFRILIQPPTLGILSIDDDVLRPCEAIDAGFFKWTEAPDRMVGFDGRLHVENDDGNWQYGYMSTTEKANRYSMSLTRYCFIHKDYLDIYMNELPLSILDNIAKNFNGEDIAMSFLISSMTDGKPPLLADAWAIKSMVKLYVEKKISGGHDHKRLRDTYVDSFAQILGLKEVGSLRRLQSARLYHHQDSFFECGDAIREKKERSPPSERQVTLQQLLKGWHNKGRAVMQTEMQRLMSGAAYNAYKRGLIEKSDPWKERFSSKA